MKVPDNLSTLEEFGEDIGENDIGENDHQEMFDNLEKSWKLISQPGVKIIPIPRIG